MPRLRDRPEDFFVEECPLFEPEGRGGHTYVFLEKRLRDTEAVARDLARVAGVRPRDVGYAGRKDRLAVTRQWFSVPGLAPAAALDLALDGVSVLRAVCHGHKLRTGQLAGNRFRLVLRDVDAALAEQAREAARRAESVGVANRFGRQRFGRGGENVDRGRDVLLGRSRSSDRRRARFWLSALQAAVFNEALRRRPLPLDRLECGEVAMLASSGGAFVVEDEARENERAAAFELHPTGPLFGTRLLEARGAAAKREREAQEALDVPPDWAERAPPGLRLRGARRAARFRPEELSLAYAEGCLHLSFQLPAGSYATVLVEELVGSVDEPATGRPDDSRPSQGVC
ncbi:MAG: tRNA pseudouridine(13) synthase TruD [Proteobacteria bacterium]|nr:tRNA pseudouridine(13) synthase TruD [Pseudomonadota bacterium]